MPVIDSLPLIVARDKPIFAENRLAVEMLRFSRLSELRNALINGEVDAIITDLAEAFLINESKEFGKIVRVSLKPSQDRHEQTVIIFSQRMLEKQPAVIRRFLRAYEQSVREINMRPWRYLPLAREFVRGPIGVSTKMPIPSFPFPGEVPLEADIEAAGTWLLMKKIIPRPISYNQLVHSGFLWDPSQFRPASCCGW
jgi:ABC-type nitrate/sulfonate/bicarbonate transport system substrate-binding protein